MVVVLIVLSNINPVHVSMLRHPSHKLYIYIYSFCYFIKILTKYLVLFFRRALLSSYCNGRTLSKYVCFVCACVVHYDDKWKKFKKMKGPCFSIFFYNRYRFSRHGLFSYSSPFLPSSNLPCLILPLVCPCGGGNGLFSHCVSSEKLQT